MELAPPSAAPHAPSGSAAVSSDAPEQPTLQIGLARTAILGAIGTAAIVVGALLGGQSFETHLPGAWFFGMPGGPLGWLGTNDAMPPIAALALVFGGLILLTRVWLGFLRYLKNNDGFPVKRVVLVVVVWAVPLLLAPPLFSRDVYTYAAQGEMVTHHINPYLYGPNVLGSTPFNNFGDPYWAGHESPYGPAFLGVDGVVDQASGHNFLVDLVLLRLLEVAGIALMVAATPTLARWVKRDPAHAVLLGAGSPLVLMSLLAGDHNDALMVGLLLTGLAVAKRFGTVPGVVVCALAAGVKSPAALGVLFLGWTWPGPDAPTRRRVGHTALAGLIALTTIELVTVVTGFGWGWIKTTMNADSAFTGVTPINLVARGASILSHLFQVPVSTSHFHVVFGVLGMLIAAYVGYRLLLRSPREGVVPCLGMALLVLALLGPIVWAWYVTWGVVLLSTVASGRLRSALIVISTFWAFAGVTSVHNIYMRMIHTFVVPDLLLVALLLAVAVMPLVQFPTVRPDRSPLPRWRPRPDDAGPARRPLLGDGALAGAGAGGGS